MLKVWSTLPILILLYWIFGDSSDDDARQAMMRNMSAINGTTVGLYLSSKSEMQQAIEEARSSDSTTTAAAATPAPSQTQQHMMQQQNLQHQHNMQG